MRTRGLLLVCVAALGIAASSCKGPQLSYAPDASLAGAADDGAGGSAGGSSGSGTAGGCNAPPNDNSAPIGSCLSAAKFVDCTLDGASAGCLSNGPNSCAGLEGATCVSKCAGNQFAVSCGGPGADAGVMYEPVPANCEVIATTPSGKSYACCSCAGAK